MVLSILLSLLGRNTLVWFVDLTSLGAIIGFGYSSAAAYKLARAEGNRKTVVTGLIGAIISVIFFIVQLVPGAGGHGGHGKRSVPAACILVPAWICLLLEDGHQSTLTEYSGMSTSGIVLFALLVYSA